MFSISAIILIVFVVLGLLKLLMKDYKLLRKFPGPTLYPIMGNFFELVGTNQSDVFKLMRKYCAKYGTFRLWAVGIGHIHTSRAKEAEILLSTSKHTEKSEMYRYLTDFLGTGLLISNGQKWQQRRKILTPAFHFHILQQFTSIFDEESVKVVAMIKGLLAKEERVLDVAKISCRLTLNIICESAMGVKLDAEGNQADEYRNNLYKVTKIIVHRVMRAWLYIDWVFKVLGYQKLVDEYVAKIQEFTKSIINRRRKMFHESHQGEQHTRTDDLTNENM